MNRLYFAKKAPFVLLMARRRPYPLTTLLRRICYSLFFEYKGLWPGNGKYVLLFLCRKLSHSSFPKLSSQKRQSIDRGKSMLWYGSRNALTLSTQCIVFFRSLNKNGAQPCIKVVRHACIVMQSLLLHASLITDEQGRIGACLSDGVEEGTFQFHVYRIWWGGFFSGIPIPSVCCCDCGLSSLFVYSYTGLLNDCP